MSNLYILQLARNTRHDFRFELWTDDADDAIELSTWTRAITDNGSIANTALAIDFTTAPPSASPNETSRPKNHEHQDDVASTAIMTSIMTTSRRLLTSALRPVSSSSASSASSPLSLIRSFSTTPPPQTKTIKPHRLPSDIIPPYPYGERRIYKQSNNGLYGAARIRFGNTVAPKHSNKARRFWKPNVHVKTFLLPSLAARIKTRLTLRVLKTIRKEGGLEAYLLKDKPARVKELGPGGWNLRWLVMQSGEVQRRFEEERRALGLEGREVLVDREDVIQYALDYATPGPLSVRSRRTVEGIRAAAAAALEGEFTLGNEDLAAVEGVRELSDEEEEALLRETDGKEGEQVVVSTEGNTRGSPVS